MGYSALCKSLKKYIKKIPILPLSAIIFYLIVVLLWNLNIIPSTKELIAILENLYKSYGYLGLVIATFLESLAYICLYVPGTFVIALSVFFSDGTFGQLFTISVLVAVTLTLTSFINYLAGRFVVTKNFWEKREFIKESKQFNSGFLFSLLHPNLLAFYFFNSGLQGKNKKHIAFVPILMLPYGIFVAFTLSRLSGVIRPGLENPKTMLILLLLWFVITFVFEERKRKTPKVLDVQLQT